MEIINKKLEEITPYEKNPRKNDEAVEYVANSIKEFGFKVPIIIDKNNVIVTGHTRYKAAKKLGLEEVPTIMADDLNEEQIKAFRLADNKVSERSYWDFSLLNEELNGLLNMDMENFGFSDFNVDNFIDSLIEEQDGANLTTKDTFSITFVFNKKNEDKFAKYFKENGKDEIVSLIEKHILGDD